MLRLFICVFLLATLTLPVATQGAVQTGAEVLARQNFQPIRGKRFGLITNQSAQVHGVHLIDLMERSGVKPALIFTPEHGLEGGAEDGVKLCGGNRRGIPVRSLYGTELKPSPAELKGLDALLFDIQDVGVRYYTFISTMGLAMQAAAQAGVPFVVLDRPNPLGGDYVAGFSRDDIPQSFTSLFPIPMVHGLTVGELALMIKGEGMLPGMDALDLSVIPMQGWERTMRWPDTGLPFITTSPNIPGFETSLLYAGMGLVEATDVSEGRGTEDPFHLLGAPGIDPEALAQGLNHAGLSGLRFEPARFVPKRIPGKCSDPKFEGREIGGVRVEITDYHEVHPVEAGLTVLAAFYQAIAPEQRRLFFQGGFDDMAGSTQLRKVLSRGGRPDEIAAMWSDEVGEFLKKREPYLLYPELADPDSQPGDEEPE